MSYDTRELMARLIQCEAESEGITGMQAVASVIINRSIVPNGEFSRVSKGGDVRSIILQQDQFTCMKEDVNGKYNRQNIYNMTPTPKIYEIADWALAGNTLPAVGDSLFFFNPYKPLCPENFPSNVGRFYARIGAHCFYSPTSLYSKT